MDHETDEPPTSIISPGESNFSQVIFPDVQQFYTPNTDVKCQFRKGGNFHSGKKDWIGIFKVGWKTTREYFTWISALSNEEDTALFKAYYLPKDDDYYQFCYVDQNGIVRGASVPFQFCNKDEDEILVVTTEVEMMRPNKENAELKETVEKMTKERSALEENIFSLKYDNQSQAEKIQTLQAELLTNEDKISKLDKENMEMQLQMTRSEEEKEKLESELKQCRDNLQKSKSEMTEMKMLLENSEAEKNNFQSENQAKKDTLEIMNGTVNLFKEEAVKLRAEIETLSFENEKKHKEELQQQKEKLQHSLDEARKKALDMQCNMKEQSTKLKCTQDTLSSLQTQVALTQVQMKTVENVRKKNEKLQESLDKQNKAFLDSERKVGDLRTKLISTEERMSVLDQGLALLQDENRKKEEQIQIFRNTMDLRESEIQDLREQHKEDLIDIDELHSRLLQGQESTPTSQSTNLLYRSPYEGDNASLSREHENTQPLNPFKCPECFQEFPADKHQVFEDHVMCHSIEN